MLARADEYRIGRDGHKVVALTLATRCSANDRFGSKRAADLSDLRGRYAPETGRPGRRPSSPVRARFGSCRLSMAGDSNLRRGPAAIPAAPHTWLWQEFRIQEDFDAASGARLPSEACAFERHTLASREIMWRRSPNIPE